MPGALGAGLRWAVPAAAAAAGVALRDCLFLSASGPLAVAAGLPWSLCAVPVATAALMALGGWRLLSEATPTLLFAASRR